MLGQDIGIDLGTSSILIYVKERGIIANEPSVVAIDKESGQLLAVGREAQQCSAEHREVLSRCVLLKRE